MPKGYLRPPRQRSDLVDFFHACDYLSAAGKASASSEQEPTMWMDEQKVQLKTNQADEVLQALRMHLELPTARDGDAPVRQCHRYIVQQRMKRPGAWWCPHNAEHMLALRLNRANRQWDRYWQSIPDKQHGQITTSV